MPVSEEQILVRTSGNWIMDNMLCLVLLEEFLVSFELIDTLVYEIVSKSLLLVSKLSQGFLNQLVLKNGYLSTCKCYHLSCSLINLFLLLSNYDVWYKMPLNAS